MSTGTSTQSGTLPIVNVVKSIKAGLAKVLAGRKSSKASAEYAFALAEDVGPIPAGAAKYPDGTWLSVEAQFVEAGLASLAGEEMRREVAYAQFFGSLDATRISDISWTIHKIASKRPTVKTQWVAKDAMGMIADFIDAGGADKRSKYFEVGCHGDASLATVARFSAYRQLRYPAQTATTTTTTPATSGEEGEGENVSEGDDKDGGTDNGRLKIFLQSSDFMVSQWSGMSAFDRKRAHQAASLVAALPIEDVDDDDDDRG